MNEKDNFTCFQQNLEKLSVITSDILEGIPSGLAIYHVNKNEVQPVYQNSAYYQVMGYSDEHIEEIRRGSIFLGVHPDDLQQLYEKAIMLLKCGKELVHIFRIFHDKSNCYHWLRLRGSRQCLKDGSILIYTVYTDITEEKRLETELRETTIKTQNIINAIPGGVALYRMADVFETIYFSNGVPELIGYTTEEYRNLIQNDAALMIYPNDRDMIVEKLRFAIRNHTTADFEFRKLHRDGHIIWVHILARQVGEADGAPLLHCVFQNITDLKETQLEMNHLINSSYGGVASYRVENNHFVPILYSDGVAALSGYTREEFDKITHGNVLESIYERDTQRILDAALQAVQTGEILNISYRTRCKNGNLAWIHMSGQRIGPLTESCKFYAYFSGVSDESRMFQNIANEAADAIYIIDRAHYEILYFHESKKIFPETENCIGKQCYAVLQGLKEPCPFCNFKKGISREDTEVVSKWNGRTYRMHVQETVWNGIPAFIQYLRDITDEVKIRQEKQRLGQYFKTLVENLPGGVAVVRRQKDGTIIPEYLSAGFADMTQTALEQAKEFYSHDALRGVHPDDIPRLRKQLDEAFTSVGRQRELTYRLKKGDDEYIWVRNTLSLLPSEDGDLRQYCYIKDITEERREQEQMREQYQKLIVQHYRTPGPNVLVVGHCNIIKNRILEINDYTGLEIFKTLGTKREEFFRTIADLIVEPEDHRKFLQMYLNEPMLKAYARQETERTFSCLIQLPREKTGRYVQFKVNLVANPDAGDVTGILTITDITEQVMSSQVLQKLSCTGYEHIIILDLSKECYNIFTSDPNAHCVPKKSGTHSEWMNYMLKNHVLPKDKEAYRTYLDSAYIARHLEKNGYYSFDFSITDSDGNFRVKRVTVFDIDLRIGRVGLSRSDVTEAVREQQSLLNMLAYTFELAAFIDIHTKRMIMHTRQTVLEDLPPFIEENYDTQISNGMLAYAAGGQNLEEIRRLFKLDSMLEQLKKFPLGYDFVCAYQAKDGLRYKKINVLWGDRIGRTVCIVRADVTEMLGDERKNKADLENALSLAKQANQAKSDFLSAMSHDIRTPMNAIMGMTALAASRPDDSKYVTECLRKISLSSKHLLNLINDVLDMSKIEHAKIVLNREHISLQDLVEQVSTMVKHQAIEKQQNFKITVGEIVHDNFYGDPLRLNQILINILSNAVKFTAAGGNIDFQVEELLVINNRVRYAFSIRDNGIGMSEEMLSRIFDPFARSSHVSRVEGTGLGLSITKGLIDQMGGTIKVESKENEGSLFYIELEFEVAQEKQSISKGKLPLKDAEFLAGRRFLIAEDNEINSEILKSLLDLQGAYAEIHSDGAQTVKAFSASPPGTYDAILMDIQMPEMNGYEAAKAIRALNHKDASAVPIIALTANAFAEDVQAALEAGMNAHIAKPIDMDMLITTLQKILS